MMIFLWVDSAEPNEFKLALILLPEMPGYYYRENLLNDAGPCFPGRNTDKGRAHRPCYDSQGPPDHDSYLTIVAERRSWRSCPESTPKRNTG